MASIRRPPQSIESEQAVLGGLLLDNNAFDQVADVIGPDDFYRRDHRLIFEKIQAMCIEGQPADVVTVYGALQAEGKAQEVGGLQYLNSLATGTPSAANIRRYSEIVRDRSILRQLVTAGTSVGMTTSTKSASETAAVPSGSITGSMTSAGGRSPGSTTLMSSMKSQ